MSGFTCGNCAESIGDFQNISEELKDKTAKHPCYSPEAHKYARMHIPVAPECNVSCNYCNRKYDCVNESRPGVTSEVLSPQEACDKYIYVKEKIDNLKVVGIAGPGDALANFETVKKSIALIKEKDPETVICLSTNGLMLPKYAGELVEMGIQHVTITINTIDPKIGAQIYKFVKYEGKVLKGEEGASVLLKNQLLGLKYLAEHRVLCKVNIVMIKGLNDEHIEEVVKKVKELGAFMTNIMPLIPAEGSVFQNMPLVSNHELNELRKKCSIDLKQMYHCKQCRADAIGMLSQDRSLEFRNIGKEIEGEKLLSSNIAKDKKYIFAVASKDGKIIDQHFGHVDKFYIYSLDNEGIKLIDKRDVDKYCIDKENCYNDSHRMENIIDMLSDCTSVLSMRMGYEPKKRLGERNIKSYEFYDTIENGIKKAQKLIEGSAVNE